MKVKDMVSMSVGNLRKRKVRTCLTVAGVVIGTCAIVVMVSFGLGLSKSMDDSLAQMGDLTMIQVYNYNQSADSPKLDDSVVEAISQLDHVAAATPVYNVPWGINIMSGKYQFSGTVYGLDLDALEPLGYQLEEGEFPSGEQKSNVILFSRDGLYQFYNTKKNSNNWVNQIPDANGNIPDPYVNPMKDKLEAVVMNQENMTPSSGKPVKLQSTGLLAADYSKNPSPSYAAFIDISLAKKLTEAYNKENDVKNTTGTTYQQVIVKAEDIAYVEQIEPAFNALGLTDTRSMESIRKPMEQHLQTVQLILGGLGAVSLIVAALGITNTMIMSIYERTREIGVMKVLGCVVGDIRTMFLVEAGLIGLMGGIVGIGVSYLLSAIINHLVSSGQGGSMLGGMLGMAGGGTQISLIPPWRARGAIVFAIGVGRLSGVLPANRAVKISALTAIKQE